jgi:hypothetical protein
MLCKILVVYVQCIIYNKSFRLMLDINMINNYYLLYFYK